MAHIHEGVIRGLKKLADTVVPKPAPSDYERQQAHPYRGRCLLCTYWNRGAQEPKSHAECRYNPPTVVSGVSVSGVVAKWPHTAEGDWCGRYSYRMDRTPIADLRKVS